MNRQISVLSITAYLFILTGCVKYLEIEPSQSIPEEIALTSDEKIKKVLIGAYSGFSSYSIYGGNLLRNAELLGGNGDIGHAAGCPGIGGERVARPGIGARNAEVVDGDAVAGLHRYCRAQDIEAAVSGGNREIEIVIANAAVALRTVASAATGGEKLQINYAAHRGDAHTIGQRQPDIPCHAA